MAMKGLSFSRPIRLRDAFQLEAAGELLSHYGAKLYLDQVRAKTQISNA